LAHLITILMTRFPTPSRCFEKRFIIISILTSLHLFFLCLPHLHQVIRTRWWFLEGFWKGWIGTSGSEGFHTLSHYRQSPALGSQVILSSTYQNAIRKRSELIRAYHMTVPPGLSLPQKKRV
jgi:hypothetical protein